MKKEKQSLFRKKALENIQFGQQLDERIKIVTLGSWILAVVLMIIIVAGVIWGFIGNIPIRVDGQGILLAAKGSLYNAVAPEGSGRIISIVVKPGDSVDKGQIVAHLNTPDLQQQYEVAKRYLRRLQSEYAKLQQESKDEIKKRKAELEKQNVILNRIIHSEKENLKKVAELLKIKQASFKKGITTRQDVIQTSQDYFAVKRGIEKSLETLAQNSVRESDFINQWHQQWRDLELKIAQQENEVMKLKATLTISKDVRSPIAGIVTHIQATVGEKVDGGETVATITNKTEDLDAIIYIPLKEGKRVKVGMAVLISPSTIKKEEYGSINATVVSVSPFPSTAKTMEAVLQNKRLVELFSERGSPIAIRVILIKNNKNYSGYAWTSSAGPKIYITAGTLVSAMITVRNQRPVALIIPTVKKLLGS